MMTMRFKKNFYKLWSAFGLRRKCYFALPYLLLGAFLISPTSAFGAVITDVQAWAAPDRTKVVLSLSGAAEFSSLVLTSPNRLVIDLKKSLLKTDIDKVSLGGTIIQNVRFGIRDGVNLRLVFDVTSNFEAEVFSIPADGVRGHRIVAELYDNAKVVGESQVQTTLSVDALNKEKRDILIAIDAGHGGEDPGALGLNGAKEKRIVLQISRRLEKHLKAIPGLKPVLIRSGDYYISLGNRRNQVRAMKADLLLSIHADAFRQRSAHGASVYALSLQGATSTTARFLVANENSTDLVGGVEFDEIDPDLAEVLTEISMDGTLDTSLGIGEAVLEHLGKVTRLHKKRVERAGFGVLKSPDVPSLLVETGFISNPAESERLTTPSFQEKIAIAIARGVQSWFSRQPPPGSLLAWQREQKVRELTISYGDTLSEIAHRFGVSLWSVKAMNNMDGDVIYPGQILLIPEE